MRRTPRLGTLLLVGLSALFILAMGVACVVETQENGWLPAATPTTPTPEATATATQDVEGTAQTVDASAGLLTLLRADGSTLEVNVDQSTTIIINGSTGTLADIQSGDRVEVEVDQTTSLATTVTVESQEADTETVRQGKVENVDSQLGLLVLVTSAGDSLVVSVDQSTTITINGSTGTLADIQSGDTVEVEVEQGTDVATAVVVESAEEEEPVVTKQQGTVEGKDTDDGEITVLLETGSVVTVKLDQSTKITINGSTGTLADIQTGDTVEIEVDQDTKVATAVVVESEEKEAATTKRQGKVESKDTDDGEITVELDTGTVVTVKVDQSTKITINGSTGTLADIQTGDTVEVEVDQDTGVATSVTVDSEAEVTGSTQQGTVETADPESGEIKVLLETGNVVTVNVDQSTSITINGSTGTLADVKTGDSVQVEVDQSTQVATSVSVRSHQVTSVGEIREVSPLSQTVTVETEDNRVLRLRFLLLDGSTRVIIEGGQGSLLDLVQGSHVEVTYNPETMVVSTIHVRTKTNGG